ncbi:Mlp family lipoprotein [Seonamhaeicola sp. NFXS20]|uniref:hypothetical protein n=1 Tax=unclassified Seonamhaeicola TaxID=2622645 RepID=UPI003564708B
MKPKKESTLKFYLNFGKLFYAIAASDKQVHELEFNKLKEVVKKQWLNINSFEDDYNKDAAYQIEIVFDWLSQKGNLSANSCFDDFINYKNEQKHLFTTSIKKLIMKTAHAVANAFSGINKAELIMLAKLDLELKK